MIKIINKKEYEELKNNNETLKKCNKELAKVNGESSKQIVELKEKNQKLEIDNAALRDIQLMDETEIEKLKESVSKKSKLIDNLNKKLKISKETNEKLGNQKGGLTKENNRLRDKLDGKVQVIKEYEKALSELEKKNEMQLLKIQELTKQINHSVQEYRNNGLPKQTKETFKKVTKKGKKK